MANKTATKKTAKEIVFKDYEILVSVKYPAESRFLIHLDRDKAESDNAEAVDSAIRKALKEHGQTLSDEVGKAEFGEIHGFKEYRDREKELKAELKGFRNFKKQFKTSD